MHGFSVLDTKCFLKSRHDKYQGNQTGETFFCKSGDVSYKCTKVKRNYQENEETGPKSYPDTKW
jgi:hypothetical protein